MFAFVPSEYLWAVPLIFVTGWIIGYVHFRDALHRRHPDLYEEWRRRTKPNEKHEEQP